MRTDGIIVTNDESEKESSSSSEEESDMEYAIQGEALVSS